MSTKINSISKPNINQPTRAKWCTACQMGEHCGHCVCCRGRALPPSPLADFIGSLHQPLPAPIACTELALQLASRDVGEVEGFSWLRSSGAKIGPVDLMEVCGGSGSPALVQAVA